MATIYIPMDTVVQGSLTVTGAKPSVAKTDHTQIQGAEYMIPWTDWRVFDAFQTNLPGVSADDDLGLYGATHGTGVPSIQSYDVKAAGAVSLKARACFHFPPEYDTGETATIRAVAGMVTTVAGVSATIDFAAYLSDGFGAVSGGDLVTTAATSINVLGAANKDFVLTATNLAPGSVIDILMTVALNDAATGTAVIARVGSVKLLLDTRG